MNLFASISLTVSILCALLAIFTFLQARNQMHRIWGIFNLNVALWSLGLYFVGIAQSSSQALLYWKLTFVPNTFIAVFFYHVVYSFCQLQGKRFLIFAYLQGILFALIILFYKPFFTELNLIFNTIYFAKATPLVSLWLSIFSFITGFVFYKTWQFSKITHGDKKRETLYLFWSMLIGFAGGYTIALPWYNIFVYPAWHFSICIYTAIFTFAVLRHHFLDIRVALSRLLVPVSIFAAVSFIFCFIYFDLNLFTAASITLAILCSLLAYMIFAYAREKMQYMWALFNIAVAVWGYSAFFIGRCTDPQLAIILWRIAFIGVLFISVFFYHVSCLFCQISRPKTIAFAYGQGLFFLLLNFSDLYISKVFQINNSFYYLKSYGFFYPISFLIWLGLVSLGIYELIIHFYKAAGIKKQQLLYLFVGFGTGFVGGITNFLPTFGINVYPFGNVTIPLYCIIATYAILRYQLMDIRIAVTRVGIFVLVYLLILGIPFGLTFWGKEILVSVFGQHWHWVPIILCTIFATAGPFIFLHFQRRAEKALLQEEQRTQDLLMQASYGMNTIHNLQKLLDLIVTLVVRILRVDSGKIFLLNREGDQYMLKSPTENNGLAFNRDDPLVEQLRQKQYPIIYDEMKVLSEMNGEAEQKEVETRMREISVQVIVPITLNNSLLGFLALGERHSKDMYTKGLLNTLSVLGNQAAVAIDRCHYIEAETKRLEAEGLKERMVSLDHMASSMAHEIDNPMHIIRTSLSFVQGALLRDPRVAMPEEVKQDFDESLVRSLNASERVSSMIKAILDYSRMGTGKLESIRISDALEGFLQLIQPQIREEKVQFMKEIENDLPPVLGDRVQMEEVFMNFVRNSLHAVRRNEEKKISLKIFKKDESTIRMECWDNGYGIAKEIINDIFLSSMTTKGSSEGTGLGLYRVRKIVDLFGGKVWAESEGKGKGATFVVELPIYEGHKNNSK